MEQTTKRPDRATGNRPAEPLSEAHEESSDDAYIDRAAGQIKTPVNAGGLHVIRFSLDQPTPLLNRTLRSHWAVRRRYMRALCEEVAFKTVGQRPAQPFQRAKVTITRRSVGRPDRDNLYGGIKGIVDLLLPVSTTHPFGLGFVADDNDICMDLSVVAVPVRTRREQGTDVVIERIE